MSTSFATTPANFVRPARDLRIFSEQVIAHAREEYLFQ